MYITMKFLSGVITYHGKYVTFDTEVEVLDADCPDENDLGLGSTYDPALVLVGLSYTLIPPPD
jgi:hypothetical protein